MIGTLIGIIFLLVIAGVIWWAVQQLIGLIPMAEPFKTAVRVLMILILVLIVLWIIAMLLGMVGINVTTSLPRSFR
jgi:hypothetical protein